VQNGTPEQERFFAVLWRDYFLARAVYGAHDPARMGRRWREGIALFASNHAALEIALSKAQIDLWRNAK